jgi:hypothetical protein
MKDSEYEVDILLKSVNSMYSLYCGQLEQKSGEMCMNYGYMIPLEKNINFSIQLSRRKLALTVTHLGDFPWKSYEQCT